MSESIRRLEEKIAYLEHHVTEQDKAMLGLAGDLAQLRKELLKLRERLGGAAAGGPDDAPMDSRPPHY